MKKYNSKHASDYLTNVRDFWFSGWFSVYLWSFAIIQSLPAFFDKISYGVITLIGILLIPPLFFTIYNGFKK